MRVLLTTDTIGGVWTFTRELTTELLRRNHSVALVSFGRAPSSEQALWCAEIGARYPDTFSYTPSCASLEWMQGNRRALTDALPVSAPVSRTGFSLISSTQASFASGIYRSPFPPSSPHTATYSAGLMLVDRKVWRRARGLRSIGRWCKEGFTLRRLLLRQHAG